MNNTGIFAVKPIADYHEEAAGKHLVRALGVPALVAFGIGGIIGTGIFVLTGLAAAQHAGPAIVISFIIAGIGCMFALSLIHIFLKVPAQGELPAGECQVAPGDLGLGIQADLLTLGSGGVSRLDQACAKHDVHLVCMDDADDRQQRAHLDRRPRLFVAFARGGRLQGFAVLHESGRYGPIAEPRLDGAAAQENPALPLGHASQHQQRILVVHLAAIRAHEAGQMVPLGNFQYDG